MSEPEPSVEDTTPSPPLSRRERLNAFVCDWLDPISPSTAVLLFLLGVSQYMTGALLFLYLLSLLIPITEILNFFTITSIATWASPGFGFICDLLVIRGRRRKPILIVCTIILTVLWPIIAAVQKEKVTLALAIVEAFFNSIQNTTLNGLIVETTPGLRDGKAQSRVMLIRTFASFTGAVINIILLIRIPLRVVLGLSSVFYFISIFVCVILPERLLSPPTQVQQNEMIEIQKPKAISLRMAPMAWIKLMLSLCTNIGFIGSFLFVFIYTAVPDSSTPYFSYVASLYSFDPLILSIFNAFGLLGGVFGSYFYVRVLSSVNVRFTFIVGTLCYILALLSNLILVSGFWKLIRLPIYIFVPLDQFIVTFFQRIAFIPVVHLGSMCSPTNVESEVFEFFAVLAFVGGTLSGTLSSLVTGLFHITETDYTDLKWLILVCVGFRFVAMFFVFFVPRKPIPYARYQALIEEEPTQN